jgi:DNA-binding HxlR family transcriptional regulator
MKLENVTSSSQPPSRRRYEDACGTALGLDLIGERWALLVVRELLLGPKRFSDLKADLPGISANVLTQRLESLESHGILRRRRLPPPAPVQVYELTEWGYEAEPIMQTLGRWAVRSPEHDPTQWISATSILISFRTMLSAQRAAGLAARIGFRFGRESFLGRLEGGTISYARGPFEAADVVFEGAPGALGAAVYGGVPFEDLAAAGALKVEGDMELARRFTTLFVLPPRFVAPPA